MSLSALARVAGSELGNMRRFGRWSLGRTWKWGTSVECNALQWKPFFSRGQMMPVPWKPAVVVGDLQPWPEDRATLMLALVGREALSGGQSRKKEVRRLLSFIYNIFIFCLSSCLKFLTGKKKERNITINNTHLNQLINKTVLFLKKIHFSIVKPIYWNRQPIHRIVRTCLSFLHFESFEICVSQNACCVTLLPPQSYSKGR